MMRPGFPPGALRVYVCERSTLEGQYVGSCRCRRLKKWDGKGWFFCAVVVSFCACCLMLHCRRA